MTDTILVILPLILLVAAGWIITRAGWLMPDDWRSIEDLSFKILIPALLIRSIYRSDISLEAAGPYVGAMVLVVLCSGLIGLSLRLITSQEDLPQTQLSTLFQVTTRWNAFIVLPIAFQIFGPAGLTAVAIAMAFLVPLIQIGNIGIISTLHGIGTNPRTIGKAILKNPLVIGSMAGLAINLSGLEPPEVVDTTLDLIGRAALGIGLLCIGASFDWRKLMRPGLAVVWGVGTKIVVAPLLFFAMAGLLNLNALETLCGMLVVAAPAATNGYIIAKKMGGDADLYANIMSWQLVLSVLTIPLTVALAGSRLF